MPKNIFHDYNSICQIYKTRALWSLSRQLLTQVYGKLIICIYIFYTKHHINCWVHGFDVMVQHSNPTASYCYLCVLRFFLLLYIFIRKIYYIYNIQQVVVQCGLWSTVFPVVDILENAMDDNTIGNARLPTPGLCHFSQITQQFNRKAVFLIVFNR